jgi:hypothetical protein
MPLSFTNSLATRANIIFIYKILACLSLAIVALSLLHKMIGLEYIVACQMVYLSYAFYSRPTYVNSSITSFQMVTSYRSSFYQRAYGDVLPPFTYATEMSKQFLESNLLWIAVVIVVILSLFGWVVFKAVQSGKKDKSIVESASFRSRLRNLYNVLIFPIVGFNFVVLLTSAIVNNTRNSEISGVIFSSALSNLCLVIGLTVSGIVLGLELIIMRKDRCEEIEVGGEYEIKHWYVPVFLAKVLLEVLLISFFMVSTAPWVIFALAGLQVLYLAILIYLRPYESIFSNLVAIIYNFVVFLSTVLVFLNKYFELGEDLDIIFQFVLEGALGIIACLCITRILRFYYHLYKAKFGSKDGKVIEKKKSS